MIIPYNVWKSYRWKYGESTEQYWMWTKLRLLSFPYECIGEWWVCCVVQAFSTFQMKFIYFVISLLALVLWLVVKSHERQAKYMKKTTKKKKENNLKKYKCNEYESSIKTKNFAFYQISSSLLNYIFVYLFFPCLVFVIVFCSWIFVYIYMYIHLTDKGYTEKASIVHCLHNFRDIGHNLLKSVINMGKLWYSVYNTKLLERTVKHFHK